MKSFTEYQQELIDYVTEEMEELEKQIEDRDPALFGKAGLLDSVSNRMGYMSQYLRDVQDAVTTDELIDIDNNATW